MKLDELLAARGDGAKDGDSDDARNQGKKEGDTEGAGGGVLLYVGGGARAVWEILR